MSDTSNDPIAEYVVVHQYVSTACQHQLHARCRRTCKFCETYCLCACHRTFKAVEDPEFILPWNIYEERTDG